MKNQDEEVIALENKKIIQENDKVDKVDEVDDEIEEPFKISKKGLNNIMNNYLSRKLDEELSYIQLKGGIKFLEEALQTDFKNLRLYLYCFNGFDTPAFGSYFF